MSRIFTNTRLGGLLICLLSVAPLQAVADTLYTYEADDKSYPYTVVESGDNFTFEFKKDIPRESGRLKAAAHIFRSIYGDDSVSPQYSEFFMKETARCFAFDGRFYTYRICFLPNDYSPEKKERFWGFTNRLPNSLWFLTRNILPLALFGAVLYFLFREKHTRNRTTEGTKGIVDAH
jgi:hypothetical protein